MRKNRSPEEVYDDLVSQGSYEEAHLEIAEVQKVLTMAREDFLCAQNIKQIQKPSWRIVFNAYYDVFRELCDQLLRFKGQKISNHQGVFAFIMLNFSELELDWEFLERIRTARNENKYKGADVSQAMWKSIEFKFEIYISAVDKKVAELINEHR